MTYNLRTNTEAAMPSINPLRLASLVVLCLAACVSPRSTPVADPPATMRDKDAGPAEVGRPDTATTPAPAPTANTCEPGFHACDGVCVNSSDVKHCGIACDPCPQITGGETSCDGQSCKVRCPTGQKPCDDKCVAENAACAGCPMGKNACNDICVLATDKTACGPGCVVCPSSANGKSECNGTECVLTCDPGYHRCGDACSKDDAVESCGTSCTPCMPAQGGGAKCVGGVCQLTCPAGTELCKGTGACLKAGTPCDGMCPSGKHDCNNQCVADDSVNSCGGMCSPCPTAPSGGKSVCVGGKCDYECTSGHKCNGGCKQCCDVSDCPAQANRTASCNNGACKYVDNCTPDVMCAADQECLIFRTTCPGGVKQCSAFNKSNNTRCGSGAGAGTCSNGVCISACANVDCGAHGSCSSGNCSCRDGYSGNRCQTPPDPCAGINCGAHGTCSGGGCSCRDGFSGDRCQNDPCAGINCGAHGTCSGGACSCRDGFSGSSCTTCNGMTCGGQCKAKVATCVALIRSQTGDSCFVPAAGLACNAPKFDDRACQIGVITRKYIAEGAACDTATFNALGRDGCSFYVSNNRQPGLDPTKPIAVSFTRESVDANGNISGALPSQGESDCRTLGVNY
jgi:hypothetical protein